jgi:hypothetical protein
MSDYTPVNDFSAKDSLTTGDPEKIILGSDVDNETAAIQTAIGTKFDVSNWATLGATLGNGSIADIAAFTDANADRIYGWDDSASAAIQFALGGALSTSGTTLQVTAADILTQIKTVDGSGSGLDADTLDGHETTYFTDAGNLTGSLADARLSANVPLLNANNTFSNSGATTFAGTHISLNGTGFIRLDTANTFRVQAGTSGYAFYANDNTTALLTLSNTGNYDFKGGSVTNTGATSQQVGFNGIPNVGVTSSSYTVGTTLALAEANWSVGYSGSGGDTFTIPSNATRAWAIGTTIHFFNVGSGAVNIALTSDTLRLAGTTTTGTRSLAANGFATAEKVATTTWLISGPGLT